MKTILVLVALFAVGCTQRPAASPATCAEPVSVFSGVVEVSRVCAGPDLSREIYTRRAAGERATIGYQGQNPLTHIRSPFLR